MDQDRIKIKQGNYLYGWCNWNRSKRICEVCHEQYTPTSTTQKYCPDCKDTAYKSVLMKREAKMGKGVK